MSSAPSGGDAFLFSGVPHPDSPDGQKLTFHDLGFFDHMEREACVLEAEAAALAYLPGYVVEETGRDLESLSGLIPAVIQSLRIVAFTTAAGAVGGAVQGSVFLGIGAIPGALFGAEVGLDAGMALLFISGVPSLVEYLSTNIGQVVELYRKGMTIAWNAPNAPRGSHEIRRAAQTLARAGAICIRVLLEAVVTYLVAKGAGAAAQRLAPLAEELRANGMGALADVVTDEGTSLVKEPKLQGKKVGSGGGVESAAVEPGESVRGETRRKRVSQKSEGPAKDRPNPSESAPKQPIASDLQQLKVAGNAPCRILQGTNGKVAIIGRSMRDNVLPYSKALEERGYYTETFGKESITDPESLKKFLAAEDQWEDLKEDWSPKRIPPDVARTSQMFKLNQEWARKLADEGYTVVDVDDPGKLGESTFYEMEKEILFNDTKLGE